YQYMNQVVRLEFNLDHPVFGQLAVRRAIAHALDRQALIDEAWLSHGEAAQGPVSPDLKPYCLTGLNAPAFDLQQAERLLDATGLVRNHAGVRLQVMLDYVPAGDGYRRTADGVARALARIGIDARVREEDFPNYIKRIYTDRSFALAV